jgi:hypothetical protein
MKIYEYTKSVKYIDYTSICDHPEDILYFDIETTGLSAARSDLYMIGYGMLEGDMTCKIFLLFNDDGCSEEKMLKYFDNTLKDYTYLVSYNGDTFDIPYMREKYRRFELETCMNKLISVDIYKSIRKYKKLLHMETMKQSDVEELVGLYRDSFISGGDLIKEYKDYLKTGSSSLEKHLITHNLDDLQGLVSITNTLNITRYMTGTFSIEEHFYDNPEQPSKLSFKLNVPLLPCRINYGMKGTYINGIDNSITVTVPVYNDTLKYFYKDYKNYYYLPAEDTAIHKSVAAYVDNEHKVKATKDTAYTKVTGYFIKCPKGFKSDMCFWEAAASKDAYVELTDKFLTDNDVMTEFIIKVFAGI